MAGCSSAAVSGSGYLAQRGNLRSRAGHLVADGLDEHDPQLPHGHVATRWSGARQRRFHHGSVRCERGNLRSGAGHLVADRFDDHGAVLPHGHAAARRPGARHRGATAGYDWNTSASAEIYDPALGTWSLTGSMTAVARKRTPQCCCWTAGCSSAGVRLLLLRPDNAGVKVYYFVWESAEIYDPVSGTWRETGSMRAGLRAGHRSTLLSDGRVLVSGGYTPIAPYLASAEIYDPAHGSWSLTAVMSTDRFGHTATLLPDGRVLVSGGSPREHRLGERGDLFAWRASHRRTRRRRKCHAPRRTARGITPMSILHAPQVISDRVSRTRRMRALTSPPVCRPGRRRPAPRRTAARSVTSRVTAVRLVLSPGTRWTRRRRRSRSRCRWRVRHTV